MRSDCILTKDLDYCYLCGKPAHGVHHLLFGTNRNTADKYGIYIPICDQCHTLGVKAERIHDNPMAEKLSKIVGQLVWELSQVTDSEQRTELIIKFRQEFGKSFL